MSYKIGVVAHISRLEQAEALASTVDADYIAVDDGSLGVEGNHKRVWAWMEQNNPNPWSVVLEDDAVPVEGFRAQLKQALAVAPAPIVSLYLGRVRPPQYQEQIEKAVLQAHEKDASFIISPYLLHAVGVAIHTEHIASMLHHDVLLPIDQAITWWARRTHKPVVYTMPSLVDHADGPTVATHMDNKTRTPGRIAWSAGTRTKWTPDKVVM